MGDLFAAPPTWPPSPFQCPSAYFDASFSNPCFAVSVFYALNGVSHLMSFSTTSGKFVYAFVVARSGCENDAVFVPSILTSPDRRVYILSISRNA